MKKRQYVILSVVWFTAIALLATSFYIYTIDFLINQIKYAIRETQSPLAVSFRFPNNTANPTANWVNTNNKQITFQIPPYSHIQFNYAILSLAGLEPLENVSLYFDQVSEEIGFLDLANQSYSLPFEVEVGTMKINSHKEYGAIIETPSENGFYEMKGHVTSKQVSYSFRIILIVADRLVD